jgi:RHS repeat-associated protein
MRRRIRQEYTWQSGAWVQTNVVHYVYDGNVVIQERDINNWPATTYTRGKDLSGSLEGAGGIGGLLSMTLNGATGPLSSNSMYYHSDGNGNVTALIAPSQTIVAKYVYDAFGNLISKSGQYADANPYRFSSKEAHPPSGLVYYLYRYYDPNLQRWVNHDPIGEAGSFNLYGFVGNNPVNVVDPYGLDYHYIGNPADFPPGMSPLYYGDTTTEQAVSAVANVGVSFMDGLAAIGNFVDWAGDQLLGDGGGQAMMMAMPEFGALGDLGAASKEAQAMQEARNLGKAGEKAACITKNTKRIPSLNNTANYRVPDVLDAENKILGEVKNVQNLSMTAQLQDYLAFAQHNGYQFQLTVDINTSLSSSVVNNVTSGAITLIQAPLR